MNERSPSISGKINQNTRMTLGKIVSTLSILVIAITLSSCGGDSKKEQYENKTQVKIKTKDKKPATNAVSATIPQSENKLGRRVFLLCAACHNVVKGEQHKVGPNLNGFLGNKAGMKADFVYSEALKNKGIVWSDETLRAWLNDPSGYVPGTKMAFIGVKNKEQQDALISYLEEVTK